MRGTRTANKGSGAILGLIVPLTERRDAMAPFVPFDQLPDMYKNLLEKAREALELSYHPHGAEQLSVGAAVLTKNGKVYTGSNIEIAGLSSSICAERSTLATAHNGGDGDQCVAIGIVTRNPNNEPTPEVSYPCGVCRQVLGEFANRSGSEEGFVIVTATTNFDQVFLTTVGELMPHFYR